MNDEVLENTVEDEETRHSETLSDTKSIYSEKNSTTELLIEKILISIYNHNIGNNAYHEEIYKNHVLKLCQQTDKYLIVLFLLKNIRKLIHKYKEIIFTKYVKSFAIKFHLKTSCKSFSQKNNLNKKFINEDNIINNKVKRTRKNYFMDSALILPKIYFPVESSIHLFDRNSESKINKEIEVKKFFAELFQIKKCLYNSAPVIEKLFKPALCEFDKFSILECEKEDFFRILVMDSFVWNEIYNIKDSNWENFIFKHINNDFSSMNKTMTEKIEYFEQIDLFRKNFDNFLKIPEISPSITERFPEDAELLEEYKINNNSFLENDLDDEITPNMKSSRTILDMNISRINPLDEEKEILEKHLQHIKIVNGEIMFSKAKNFIQAERDESDNSEIFHDIEKKEINKVTNINLTKTYSSPCKKIIKKPINPIPYHFNINNKQPRKTFVTPNNRNNQNKNDTISFKYENKSNNIKQDKNDIPSDIDDLVQYITNDDKQEIKTKKKKKKKKNKKKNKLENNDKEKTIKFTVKKDKKENQEIEQIKEELYHSSINRFKIHKIKFKYSPEWLQKISKFI